jgi:hypothetical protein
MQRIQQAIAVLALAGGSPALATTVSDPVGDFIPSFTGPHSGDLDVTSFSVVYNPATEIFAITGVLAGNINPEDDFYYVTGVDTGAGAIKPFGSIGEPNVIFDKAVIVGSEGAGEAFIGSTDLDFSISGNTFQVLVPLSLLPSTGAEPLAYAFNLWPRTDLVPTNLAAISDFAPNNAEIHPTAVPEPASWLMLLTGFAAMGGAIRFQSRRSRGKRRLEAAV